MKKKIGVVLGVALVVVMLAAVLVACVPSDPDKAVKNLKDADYVAVKLSVSDLPFGDLDENKVSAVVSGTKLLKDSVTLIYFKDTASAKDFYAELKEDYDKMSDKAKENYDFGRSGSVVYYGTPDAVKAAK